MEPIHQAAYDGDLAEVNRLIEEDGQLLNAQVRGSAKVDGIRIRGCTPLMLASLSGHDAVVARLIELGADVGLLSGFYGDLATHWACIDDNASVLALLLDGGAHVNAAGRGSWTPMMGAAVRNATRCAKVLLARKDCVLELNAKDASGRTALHYTDNPTILQLLLDAGADPTTKDKQGETPLDQAQHYNYQSCIPLFQAAIAEPQRPRTLFKARALLDASCTISNTFSDARDDGLSMVAQQRVALAAAPAYLKQRVEHEQQLPRVVLNDDGQQEREELVACLKYALGLEYGGGVHPEGQPPPPPGMPRELFTELLELMVPKWDPARRGLPLGEGLLEIDGDGDGNEEESESDDEEKDD